MRDGILSEGERGRCRVLDLICRRRLGVGMRDV